ncbi:expressed unknown protein [Seminavis robusta]|uniref:Uncharacterized protein n=1 Tax=Seminavis robusta TaxID=568900 RepID=A0A9N8DDM2_9STRA|nr:expressed unknown protein [Seminavis robusta]|eukprot:Sro90_g047281.1  (180) ;mRNA; f:32482-33021
MIPVRCTDMWRLRTLPFPFATGQCARHQERQQETKELQQIWVQVEEAHNNSLKLNKTPRPTTTNNANMSIPETIFVPQSGVDVPLRIRSRTSKGSSRPRWSEDASEAKDRNLRNIPPTLPARESPPPTVPGRLTSESRSASFDVPPRQPSRRCKEAEPPQKPCRRFSLEHVALKHAKAA